MSHHDEVSAEAIQKLSAAGIDYMIVAILSKLEWARKGDSERQLRDAESIAVIQWDRLDLDYLRHWADELRVIRQLDAVLEHASQLQEGAE